MLYFSRPLYSPINETGFTYIIDKFNDGFFSITALDSASHETIVDLDIPGFTIRTVEQGETNIIPIIIGQRKVADQFCSEIIFENVQMNSVTHTIYLLLNSIAGWTTPSGPN